MMSSASPALHAPRKRGRGEKTLIGIEVFNGVSALGGGIALMIRPDGAVLHLPHTLLDGSPFSDYLVPGLALTSLVGVGMLGAALLRGRHLPYASELEIATGAALVIFEIVEVSLIGFSPLQALYGGLGAIVFAAGARRWTVDRRPS